MNDAIPTVTDTQFAFGFRSAADLKPSVRPTTPVAAAWVAVARHIISDGLGERPTLVPRPGVDVARAMRMLGAVLNTAGAKDPVDQVARLLATWFVRVQPQGGPLAEAGLP